MKALLEFAGDHPILTFVIVLLGALLAEDLISVLANAVHSCKL